MGFCHGEQQEMKSFLLLILSLASLAVWPKQASSAHAVAKLCHKACAHSSMMTTTAAVGRWKSPLATRSCPDSLWAVPGRTTQSLYWSGRVASSLATVTTDRGATP